MLRPLLLTAVLSTFAIAAAPAAANLVTPATVVLGATDGALAAAPDTPCGGAPRCTVVQLATSGATAVSPMDGVVVAWRVRSSQTITARLRTVQPRLSNAFTATASGPLVPIPGDGAVHSYPARVPIAAGGRLALDGADLPLTFTTGNAAGGYGLVGYGTTGADTFAERDQHSGATPAAGRLLLAADVETDFDGDGYGDVTQDACRNDARAHALPCSGVTTFGSALTLAPDPRGLSGSGNPMQVLPRGADWTVPGALMSGVVTRFRFRTDPTAGDVVLQVLRPDANQETYTVVGESPTMREVPTNAVFEAPAQFPVQANDVLAARSVAPVDGRPADPGPIAALDADLLSTRQPPAKLGDTWTPGAGGVHYRLLVQADVEPDADGDRKGDLTQDQANLVLTAGDGVFTVSNLGPDAALAGHVTLSGATSAGQGSAGVTCFNAPGGATGLGCDLPPLAPGATATLTPSLGTAPGTYTTNAAVSARTTDPDADNNRATLTTRIDPYIPVLPVVTFVVKPCVNVVRGTRDDDVLRGTAFGDRLVGNDGDDLLKGYDADDCLEGGAGDDVLDGGAGNDRLAGSSGKDRLLGGKGDDRLTAGKGNDRLDGGPGNDTLSPGAGKDTIIGGSGNDTINAVDGVRETVDCGLGKDTVRADRRDRLKHCERVTRR
jgi:hypothetical protein